MHGNGEHQYEIKLKKDDLFINLSSDDVYFISKQMDKWFRILLDDSYVPVNLPPRPQPRPPEAAPPPPEPPAAFVQPVPPAPEPALTAPPPVEPVQPTQPVQPAPQPVAVAPPAPSQHATVDLPLSTPPAPQPPPQAVAIALPLPPVATAAASEIPSQPAPLPMIAVLPPAPAPVPEAAPPPPPVAVTSAPLPAEPLPPAVQDDFEAVMDTLMKDLEEEAEPEAEAPPLPPEPLRPAMDLSNITSLQDLCDRSRAVNSEDYLLLTAYYLSRWEFQSAFSLKRVNSSLVKSGLTPVNHSVLESLLSAGSLSMVPDLTGTAEVSEYMITPEGQLAATRLVSA